MEKFDFENDDSHHQSTAGPMLQPKEEGRERQALYVGQKLSFNLNHKFHLEDLPNKNRY